MQHGIVFCKLPINVHNSYIEFKVDYAIKADCHEYTFKRKKSSIHWSG